MTIVLAIECVMAGCFGAINSLLHAFENSQVNRVFLGASCDLLKDFADLKSALHIFHIPS